MASDPKPLTATSPQEELKNLKPEELAALASVGRAIEGPVVNAANSFVIHVANDAIIVLGRPTPLIMPNGIFANVATTETVAIIHMSMAALKDLSLAISDNIQLYEAAHGEIQSDGTRARAAAKK